MDTTLLSIALAASMILMLALGVWVSLTLVGIGVLGLLLSGNDQIGRCASFQESNIQPMRPGGITRCDRDCLACRQSAD